MSDFLHYVDNSTTDGTQVGNLAPNLFTDYANVAFGTGEATIDITGLSDSAAYTLVLYSRNQSGVGGRDFDVTTSGTLGSDEAVLNDAPNANFTSNINLTETINNSALSYDGNYVELTAYTTSSGELTVSLNNLPGQAGGEYDINGFQIQAIVAPEPATTAMMAVSLCALALMAYRSRSPKSSL